MNWSRLRFLLRLSPAALFATLGVVVNACESGSSGGEPTPEAGAVDSSNPSNPDGAAGGETSTSSSSGGSSGAGSSGGDGGVPTTAGGRPDPAAAFATATPIKHLVVVFGENISFDHYFGTYPSAQNNPGEPPFVAAAGTPTVNNLKSPLDPTHGFMPMPNVDLLTANPNSTNASNDAGAANPFRLGPTQAITSDQGHNYKPEQQAADNGAMDLFPLYTGTAGPPPNVDAGPSDTTGAVMAYFDGNTVSALWSYAQNYALNDNTWTSTFGPSTPGAIELVSGQTNGIVKMNHTPLSASHAVADGNGGLTLIGDADPIGDLCSSAADQVTLGGKNIGDLLNAKNISWGWFEGGFDLTITNPNGTTGCSRVTNATLPNFAYPFPDNDYIPHHEPFQYYSTTANPNHWRPSSVTSIGNTLEDDGKTTDPANHQYDAHDFFDALQLGNFPAVSYLKAPGYQDGHAGYSDPIDEQNFIVKVVTAVQASGFWSTTAIVLVYDDSDGWYDHQAPPIVNPSMSTADALNGTGMCTSGAQQNGAAPATPLKGNDGNPAQGRCGYGTRIPLLVLSPFAKKNYVDHTLLDQTSVLKFVEDNWLGGQRIQPGGSFDTIAGSIQSMMSP
jgi:phospholipase C